MDVRCDRCQTEYELDDASVTADGATVQCTTCGHTFVVTRPGPAIAGGTPAAMPSIADQPTASWMLTTEEGKTHRFRDSTTLQKWIVERRVTRGDRVCAPGSTWRKLGEIDELRPFFEVVDQADRAAATGRARSTRSEPPRASRPPAQAYVSPDPDDDDVLTTGGNGRSRYDNSSPAVVDDDDLAAAGLAGARRGRTILILLVAALAGAAGYLGFKRGPGGAPAPAAPPVTAAPPVPAAPSAAPSSPAPPAPPPAAPNPAAANPPAAAPSPAPAAAPPAAPAPAAAANTRAAPARAAVPASGGDSARPQSYERLVADGDRAIENGQTLKAQKLYDEALHLQSNGVAALTGSAYVLLDRHKPLAAIDTFKRALNLSPGYAPALFGLGEAYRLEGQPAQAVAAYNRYLETAPSGADAPAARRQVHELEGQAAPRAATEPATAP